MGSCGTCKYSFICLIQTSIISYHLSFVAISHKVHMIQSITNLALQTPTGEADDVSDLLRTIQLSFFATFCRSHGTPPSWPMSLLRADVEYLLFDGRVICFMPASSHNYLSVGAFMSRLQR